MIIDFLKRITNIKTKENGNLILCENSKGQLTEVTKNGEIVWVYKNPTGSNNYVQFDVVTSANNSIFRGEKYATDFAGFTGKDLTPQAIIEDARSAAEKLSDQEREKSKKEAEEFLVKAKNDIERERDSAMDELRSNFGGLAVSAAEQIIQRSLDENTHKDIIDNVLENAFTDKTEES